MSTEALKGLTENQSDQNQKGKASLESWNFLNQTQTRQDRKSVCHLSCLPATSSGCVGRRCSVSTAKSPFSSSVQVLPLAAASMTTRQTPLADSRPLADLLLQLLWAERCLTAVLTRRLLRGAPLSLLVLLVSGPAPSRLKALFEDTEPCWV